MILLKSIFNPNAGIIIRKHVGVNVKRNIYYRFLKQITSRKINMKIH